MTDTAALEQGSPAWINARLGKVTASRFADVMTQPRSKSVPVLDDDGLKIVLGLDDERVFKKDGKPRQTGDESLGYTLLTKEVREPGELSGTARTYMLDLAAETLTGQSQEPRTTPAMQWGIDHEPAARELYEQRMGCKVQRVGFIEHPLDAMVGGSPDGLVDDTGGIEIKCPYNPAIHLGYVLGGVMPEEHVAQVQGHMWITGRLWWDFVSYYPNFEGPGSLRLVLWRLRVFRDLEFIKRLDEAVFAFRDRLLETLCTLKTGGQKRD